MPQVRSRTVRFDGKNYVRKTTVDKEGVFRIRLPVAARKILQCEEISAPTLKEVEDLWDEKVEEYKQARTVERKVIYYRFESNSAICRPDPNDPEGLECIFDSDDISFCEGVAIAVSAQVLTETTITYSDGKEFRTYNETKSSLPSSMTNVDRSYVPGANEDRDQIIEWTPERELFFKELGEAIETLILKMDNLLKDQKQLLEAIDSGARALEFKK